MANQPLTNEVRRQILDDLKFQLLHEGGVDNWDGYSEAADEDGEITLNGLLNAGVDNWTWYDESLGNLGEYDEYLSEIPDGSTDYVPYSDWSPTPEPEPATEAPEPEPEPEKRPSEIRIIEAIAEITGDPAGAEGTYGRLREEKKVWARGTFPESFARATRSMGPSNTIDDIALRYVELIAASGELRGLLATLS